MKLYENSTERQECIALVQWADSNPKTCELLIHIPNEGKRSRITGHLLKLMGLRPGCSDYFLAVPTEHYHGLFLEMKHSKKPKARVSQNQLRFIKRMRGNKYHGAACWGARDAVTLIEQYLNNTNFDGK